MAKRAKDDSKLSPPSEGFALLGSRLWTRTPRFGAGRRSANESDVEAVRLAVDEADYCTPQAVEFRACFQTVDRYILALSDELKRGRKDSIIWCVNWQRETTMYRIRSREEIAVYETQRYG